MLVLYYISREYSQDWMAPSFSRWEVEFLFIGTVSALGPLHAYLALRPLISPMVLQIFLCKGKRYWCSRENILFLLMYFGRACSFQWSVGKHLTTNSRGRKRMEWTYLQPLLGSPLYIFPLEHFSSYQLVISE